VTPFEFDILLWYRAHAKDHPVTYENPPIWPETRDAFIGLELLEQVQTGDAREAIYRLTERGRVFVDAALATKLPVKRWVMVDEISGRVAG